MPKPSGRLVMSCALATALCLPGSLALAQAGGQTVELDEIVITAEEQIKQALGASVISAEDIEKTPVVRDLSELLRTMPGMNLTGTSASGQRGNNRQIDIRGMGPENTLILIDGKPVLSRNAVRMGRAGERDSRGDTSWVTPGMVERIEVLRGPAAARYGSGASGGVVNIITKRPTEMTAVLGLSFETPQDSMEGGTRRADLMLGGPLGERLSFRLNGSYSETDPDDPDINAEATLDPDAAPAAGREGVVTRNLGALLSWEPTGGHRLEFGLDWSRQSNRFAGDRQLGGSSDLIEALAADAAETNRMTRRTLSLTHLGEYGFGESRSFVQWEKTLNSRLCEGQAGGSEGRITYCLDSDGDGTNDAFRWNRIELDNVTAKSEWILPLDLFGRSQRLTLGVEFRGEYMHDPSSLTMDLGNGVEVPGVDPEGDNRDPDSGQTTWGLYAEDNIEWSPDLTLTPGLRFDYNSNFGGNWSPSLNATYRITDEWHMKLGVARAFKAPNLFQLNPNYVYYTRGNGCPADWPSTGGGCYVLGNPDLQAETSWNKEIGIAYEGFTGVAGSLTWFHNDYRNRIQSGMVPQNPGVPGGTAWLLRWENVPKAVVSGLEGSLALPLGERFGFTANATYMLQSENKSNGQPLSLVPDYTVNAALDWYARDNLTVTLSATSYGETPSPTHSATTGDEIENPAPRPAYTLFGLGTSWQINDGTHLSAGVSNLFDKKLYREGSGAAAGANTYNEPGRSFYVGLRSTF